VILAVSGALSVALKAQGRVWVVDAANGAGTHFTDLPAAEAAAAPTDVLLVRAGTYSAFTTSKGIAVLGVPGQTIVTTPIIGQMVVSGLPAGQAFSAHGLTLAGQAGFPARITFSGCAGVVNLQRIEPSGASANAPETHVVVHDCALVSMLECGLTAGVSSPFALSTGGSDVSIVGSRLFGRYAFSDPRVGTWSATPALTVMNGSRVLLASTTLRGGDGAAVWPYVGMYLPSEAAALLNGGRLVVGSAAGLDGILAAGIGATATLPVSAIAGAGMLLLDPATLLSPYAGAPAVAASVTATTAPAPAMRASGEALGGTAAIVLRSSPGDPFLIAAGLPAPALALPYGPLFLAPATLIYLGVGVQGGSGSTTLSLPIPGNPSLRGVGLGLQAASGAVVTLTNPVVLVLR